MMETVHVLKWYENVNVKRTKQKYLTQCFHQEKPTKYKQVNIQDTAVNVSPKRSFTTESKQIWSKSRSNQAKHSSKCSLKCAGDR